MCRARKRTRTESQHRPCDVQSLVRAGADGSGLGVGAAAETVLHGMIGGAGWPKHGESSPRSQASPITSDRSQPKRHTCLRGEDNDKCSAWAEIVSCLIEEFVVLRTLGLQT